MVYLWSYMKGEAHRQTLFFVVASKPIGVESAFLNALHRYCDIKLKNM